MRKIGTFAEAIEFLGGNAAVAAWLGVPENHVATMKHRGRAPRGCMLQFYLTLRDRGAEPAPAVFGLETFDRLIMPRARIRARKSRGRQCAMAA